MELQIEACEQEAHALLAVLGIELRQFAALPGKLYARVDASAAIDYLPGGKGKVVAKVRHRRGGAFAKLPVPQTGVAEIRHGRLACDVGQFGRLCRDYSGFCGLQGGFKAAERGVVLLGSGEQLRQSLLQFRRLCLHEGRQARQDCT